MAYTSKDIPMLVGAIRACFADDLLDSSYRKLKQKMSEREREQLPASWGHCFAASEVLYFMLGAKAAGYKSAQLAHEGGTHWYVLAPDGSVLDPTADQFATPVPYERGRDRGFPTRCNGLPSQPPSRRGRMFIERVETHLAQV